MFTSETLEKYFILAVTFSRHQNKQRNFQAWKAQLFPKTVTFLQKEKFVHYY